MKEVAQFGAVKNRFKEERDFEICGDRQNDGNSMGKINQSEVSVLIGPEFSFGQNLI